MPCPYCLHDQIVYVHGHGQCARCGINIEPCCDGGECDLAGEPTDRVALEQKPDRAVSSQDERVP